MDRLANILQAIGYHAAVLQPLLPMYIHLVFSALFPIYTGAHVSLIRPSSAAKPQKRKKSDDDDDDDEATEPSQQMEGLSPLDAIILPLFAGLTLAGLYFLIKWLEDPAILNRILNWYFSLFGVVALARLLTDCVGTVHSSLFPGMYSLRGSSWIARKDQRVFQSADSRFVEHGSPLPGSLRLLPLPSGLKGVLWALKELPSRKLEIRAYVHQILQARFMVGPFGLLSLPLAVAAELYFNLVDKPWWLTNLLGFSFAYNALIIMSPGTAWTGTLTLSSLFLYDVYFVFFTPLMETVARQIDIPAKLVFPRPGEYGDKPSYGMLGLGDIVIPGMVVGFALRFDLYLHYLRKQTRRNVSTPESKVIPDKKQSPESTSKSDDIIKTPYHPATSGWGERFWTTRQHLQASDRFKGTIFPKPYFHATLTGYVLGMLATILAMQMSDRAQPALLYLVPGILISLWGTALVKGDVRALWNFTETEGEIKPAKDADSNGKGEKSTRGWMDSLFAAKTARKMERAVESAEIADNSNGNNTQPSNQGPQNKEKKDDDGKHSPKGPRGKKSTFDRDRTNELLFFSVNLPKRVSQTSGPLEDEIPEESTLMSEECDGDGDGGEGSSLGMEGR